MRFEGGVEEEDDEVTLSLEEASIESTNIVSLPAQRAFHRCLLSTLLFWFLFAAEFWEKPRPKKPVDGGTAAAADEEGGGTSTCDDEKRG